MNDDKTTDPQEEKDEVKQEAPSELELAQAKINELTETAQRALADLQNSKKRMEEEKNSFAKFACANVFMQILPVFDSLERAEQHLPEELVENEWVKGINSIVKQFEGIMEQFQIKKMPTIGKKFDPNMHEAVASAEGEKDIITEEFEGGYTIDGETLKPAKVKVGDGS